MSVAELPSSLEDATADEIEQMLVPPDALKYRGIVRCPRRSQDVVLLGHGLEHLHLCPPQVMLATS